MIELMIRMLICSDLRPSADPALARALRLALRLRAELHVCHVSRWATLNPQPGRLRLRRECITPRQCEAWLRSHVMRMNVPIDPDLHIHVRTGRPVEGILGLIAELSPDLVAVCAHIPVPHQRRMLGIVARQLAVRSSVPLVLVPAVP